jgi:tRNA dimethylallyltransferase
VYRELEIGTGKPTPKERASRPHHLFDVLSVGERASAGWYGRVAARVLGEIRSRGAVPLLVGGSGLYLRAAQEGLHTLPPLDLSVRSRLRAEIAAEGPQALHARLERVDAATAQRLAPRDRQRIVRALEVYEASGRPLSSWLEEAGPTPAPASWRVLAVELPAEETRRRIAARTSEMMEQGWIEETRALLAAGHEESLRALRAVGYDETIAVCAGRLSRAEAEARINLRTHRLAKRQRTWFRHQIRAERLDGMLRPDALAEAARVALARGG